MIFAYTSYILVALTNHKSRMIIEETVEKIGLGDKNKQSWVIMVIVFLFQFFNTTILLVLNNANFKQQNIPILSTFFQGKYADYGG